MLPSKITKISFSVHAIKKFREAWTFSQMNFFVKVKGPQCLAPFSAPFSSLADIKKKASLQECFSVLEVEMNCTEYELRAAYLKKVSQNFYCFCRYAAIVQIFFQFSSKKGVYFRTKIRFIRQDLTVQPCF